MQRKRARSGWRIKVTAFSLWVAVVALYFLWETSGYRGFTAILAEWQFDNFGRYFPTLTYAIVVFVLSSPGYLLFFRPRRSGTTQDGARVVRSGHMFSRALASVAIGLGVTALVTLLAMLMLPTAQGTMQRFTVQRDSAILPKEGPAELRGTIAYDRIAAFDQDLIATRHSTRFAPLSPADGTTNTIQFFVELPPIGDPAFSKVQTLSGVLRQGGLPGEIVRLYRYAGYEIDRPYFVLFIDPAAMRWPYLSAAVQLLIAALLAALFALLQARRVRRLEHAPAAVEG